MDTMFKEHFESIHNHPRPASIVHSHGMGLIHPEFYGSRARNARKTDSALRIARLQQEPRTKLGIPANAITVDRLGICFGHVLGHSGSMEMTMGLR